MALAGQWFAARRNKDYATADAIRAQLRAEGVEPDELADEVQG